MARKPKSDGVDSALFVELSLTRGLDLTAAGLVHGAAVHYGCSVRWLHEGQSVDATDIAGVIAMGVMPGTRIVLQIEGQRPRALANDFLRLVGGRWSHLKLIPDPRTNP